MAVKTKAKEVSMEEALWKSADKLRGSVEPSEYKHVVLSLFFLKFASDKFEAQRAGIIAGGMEKFVDNVAFYTKDNVFYLKVDSALFAIEKTNPILKGALPDKENDIIGRMYEYFLSKFAIAEGKGKGEFYTPKTIVNLIAELIEPYDGTLYDFNAKAKLIFHAIFANRSEIIQLQKLSDLLFSRLAG